MISLYVIFKILEQDSHSARDQCDVACRRCAQAGPVVHACPLLLTIKKI